MNCLKCGREISEDEVFCMECQLDAQRYPVDPASAVYLPRRSSVEPVKKAPRRRVLPLEDQVKLLRRRLRTVAVAFLVTILLILAMLYPALAYLMEEHYRPGQNYTPMATVATVPTEAAVPSE